MSNGIFHLNDIPEGLRPAVQLLHSFPPDPAFADRPPQAIWYGPNFSLQQETSDRYVKLDYFRLQELRKAIHQLNVQFVKVHDSGMAQASLRIAAQNLLWDEETKKERKMFLLVHDLFQATYAVETDTEKVIIARRDIKPVPLNW